MHPRLIWLLALMVASGTLFAPVVSAAAPVSTAEDGVPVPASSDTYAARRSPRLNFGAAPSLLVDARPRSQAYLQFDLSEWAGRAITSAALRLQLADTAGPGIKVQLVADPWSETTLNWRNRPTAGPAVGTIAASSPAGTLAIDVSAAFPDGIVNGPSLALRVATASANGFAFSSREGSAAPALILVPVAAPTPANVCPSADGTKFYFFGRGTDHGAGLSQHGARGRATAGQTYDQILNFYYTNIELASIDGSRPIGVLLSDGFWPAADKPARITALSGGWHSTAFPDMNFPQGSYVEMWPPAESPPPPPNPDPPPTPDPCAPQSASNTGGPAGRSPSLAIGSSVSLISSPTIVPGGNWVAIAYGPDGSTLATAATPDLVVEPDSSEGTLQMAYRDEHARYVQYRGQMRLLVTSTGLQTVNVLPLETYLRGVVPSEMPASWPLEALKAQAIAARTYAWAKMRSDRIWNIKPTSANQVYLGRQHERASTDQALAETANLILTYRGALISAVYHSAAGGYTENSEYAFPNAKGEPGNVIAYLRGKPDVDLNGIAYDIAAPSYSWRGAELTMDELSYIFSRNPQTDVGAIASISYSRGVSGRVYKVVLVGSAGTKTVSGGRFKNIYNANRLSGKELQSTMFYLLPVDPSQP